jgi:hypothetical protein
MVSVTLVLYILAGRRGQRRVGISGKNHTSDCKIAARCVIDQTSGKAVLTLSLQLLMDFEWRHILHRAIWIHRIAFMTDSLHRLHQTDLYNETLRKLTI